MSDTAMAMGTPDVMMEDEMEEGGSMEGVNVTRKGEQVLEAYAGDGVDHQVVAAM